MVILLSIPSAACKGKEEAASVTNNQPTSMESDKKAIESIIKRLSTDYAPIMGMYELDMELFVSDKSQYMSNFNNILNEMAYLSPAFKEKLSNKLNQTTISKETSYLRPYVDPLFAATQVATEIKIKGFDIEDNMASVSVQLYDSFDKITCCYTELFFDKVDENWLLTGCDNSETIRNRWPATVSAEKFIGLYAKEASQDSSYSLKKDGNNYMLEFWMEKSTDIGKIKQVNVLDNGTYEIIIENISGEIVPSYIMSGNTMKVHEYNAVTDSWEDNVYIFSQGQG